MEDNKFTRTLSILGPYLWPREQRRLRLRVICALLSLAIAKLANVLVPLILGRAVDSLSNLETAPNLFFGVPLAIIVAYGFRFNLLSMSNGKFLG